MKASGAMPKTVESEINGRGLAMIAEKSATMMIRLPERYLAILLWTFGIQTAHHVWYATQSALLPRHALRIHCFSRRDATT